MGLIALGGNDGSSTSNYGQGGSDDSFQQAASAAQGNDRSSLARDDAGHEGIQPDLTPYGTDGIIKSDAITSFAAENGQAPALSPNARVSWQIGDVDPQSKTRLRTYIRKADRFLSTLATNSPTFRNILNSATKNGQRPVTIKLTRTLDNGGAVDAAFCSSDGSTISINPEAMNSLGSIEDAAVFELTNSAHTADYEDLSLSVVDGSFEQLATSTNKTAADLYAISTEKVEFQVAKEQHQVFDEARAGGVNLLPGTDHFGQNLTPQNGQPARWSTFDDELADQIAEGHTQYYVDQYGMEQQAWLAWKAQHPNGLDTTSAHAFLDGQPEANRLIGQPPSIAPVYEHVPHGVGSTSNLLGGSETALTGNPND